MGLHTQRVDIHYEKQLLPGRDDAGAIWKVLNEWLVQDEPAKNENGVDQDRRDHQKAQIHSLGLDHRLVKWTLGEVEEAEVTHFAVIELGYWI